MTSEGCGWRSRFEQSFGGWFGGVFSDLKKKKVRLIGLEWWWWQLLLSLWSSKRGVVILDLCVFVCERDGERERVCVCVAK